MLPGCSRRENVRRSRWRQIRCQVESCFARRDGVQHGRSGDASQHLRDDVRRQFRNGNRLLTTSPTDTAGFKWHPEMWPIANAMVRTVRPNARATPTKPIPRPGKAAASTALPHPPKTSQKVPINSANALFDRGIQRILSFGVNYTCAEYYDLSEVKVGTGATMTVAHGVLDADCARVENRRP